MKITILGSTGFLGKVLLSKALEKGYEVRTLVRSPEKLGEFKENVEFVDGSTFEPDKVAEAVKGSSAVISTVGPPPKNPEPSEKYEEAMRSLVEILKRQNIKRFIHIGGAVHVGGENERWRLPRKLLRFALNTVFKDGLRAKYLEWEVLKNSNIDWTLVRPPQITKRGSTGKVNADEKDLLRLKIGVDDLADFILEQVESDRWIRKAPLICSIKL